MAVHRPTHRSGVRRALIALVVATVASVATTVAVTASTVSAHPSDPSPRSAPSTAVSTTPASAETGVPSSLVAVVPCRLLDTRVSRRTPVRADETIGLDVAGRCATPTDATAAALTVTTTGSTSRGHATVFPASTGLPATSTLNFSANTTVANTAITALVDGAAEIHVSSTVHLVVDVTAVFVPAPGGATAGRFQPLDPTRVADTRTDGRRGVGDIAVALPAGVPSDATAISATITMVNSRRPGHLSVRPAGATRSRTSIVNTDPTNPTRAVTVVVPVTSAGFVVHRSVETDVVVDLAGWFTGPSASLADDGLFVAVTPHRVWDARVSHEALHPDGTAERLMGDNSHGSAIVNLTAVDTVRPGYVSVRPAGTPWAGTSSLNPRWRLPTANLAISQLSDRGLAFRSRTGTRLVVDVTGWFTGPRLQATTSPDPNPMPQRGGRVLFVSDSALAGIRWTGALDLLVGADFHADLESCRRLIGASCRGREGYAPTTAVTAIRNAPGTFDTLVMGVGYNDFSGTFALGVRSVVTAARERGISRIVWITYREPVTYRSPAGASNAATFAANNATLRSMLATGLYPEIELADWNAYTASRPEWFTSDGVHLRPEGAVEAAVFVSNTLAHLERRPCPVAGQSTGATAPGGWCARPRWTGQG